MIPGQGINSEERRAYYRFPVVPGQVARLVLAKQKVWAEVIDESATGLGVVVVGALDCSVGEIVTLQTELASAKAQVMNVHVEQACQETETLHEVRTRIGLQRLGDAPQRSVVSRLAASLREKLQTLTPRYRTWYAAILVVLVVAGGVATLAYGLKLTHGVVRVVNREMPAAGAATTSEALPGNVVHSRQVAIDSAPRETRTAGKRTAPQALLSMDECIQRTRPSMLLQPQIVQQLGLTADQQTQLKLLVTAPSDIATPEQDRRAAERALEVLRPEQLQAWRRIVSNRSPAERQ